ncbi:distal membrane-arm assembly complex protein 1 [Amblyraja radiata]|uniref:distal membrane-arm assembly complex protein 1 n=1 Tax=Amblyraja radiata TaxID=386614 RepID=UPI001402197C|nr:distal membrane-arm assembly complex protein 1 [Amblyraja radiata]
MAAPAPPPLPAPGPGGRRRQMLRECWGCRVLCGGGLMAAAAWIYASARGATQRQSPPGMGTVGQMVFALGLLSFGLVVLVDPVNKSRPKE